jgi:hypothetical protein
MFSASKTSGPSGYNISNSLRFRASASAYLNRTPASAGNRQIMTYSFWVKRGAITGDYNITNATTDANNSATLYFNSSNSQSFDVFLKVGGTNYSVTTSQVFRDPSAWYHIVVAIDTAQATASNRTKVYVNGSQVTNLLSASYVPQNSNLAFNNNVAQYIGYSSYFDGYMAEFNFIDGQALTPSSFGSTDTTTGVWKPAKYTGTYGTNGFYLQFSDIAITSGSNAGLGKDFSGNGNYWTTNNISVTSGITYDAMIDSPTNRASGTQPVGNYCVGNPLDVSVRGAFTNGNLTATCNGGGALNGGSVRLNTFNFTQLPVKWYWESTVTNISSSGRASFGMITNPYIAQNEAWSTTGGWFLRADGVQSGLTNPGSFTTNDVMMFAYDGNTGKVWIGKNGTWTNSGVPASGTGQNATLTVGTEYWLLFNCNTGGAETAVCAMNYGQRPFAYTPPSGFVSVSTPNLPDSTIVKGNTVMDATLYTGNGSAQTIVNAGGFRPDLVWQKPRSEVASHRLVDSVRGVNNVIYSNQTAAESTETNTLTAFNSNGFTGGGSNAVTAGNTAVAWQWQAGQGTNTTNTAGSITSTVSVNTTAGFSVVSFAFPAVGSQTVGHGLGVAPKMIILKSRSTATLWVVYHASTGNTGYLSLNASDAFSTNSTVWNNTSPTSSVFTLGSGFTSAGYGANGIAYCWAEIAGFSKFGSYTGNGSADGTFAYTGFRPKYVMWKRTDTSGYDWDIYDSSRDTYNLTYKELLANSTAAESSSTVLSLDLLSNGFKLRTSNANGNASGGTYIYMAFAENPFKNALAR